VGTHPGASSAATYRFIQEAYLGWNAPLLAGVAIEAGVFLSPVGIESIDVHSNWNWSRSNLFMGLPFYHLGLHVASALSENVSAHVAVYNGWNNILDNNAEKSVAGWVGFTSEDLSAQVLYFGGVEREGGNWRNLFDAWAAAEVSPWLSLALHVDGGFEPYSGSDAGWWFGTAGYVRGQPTDWLALTLRQDVFLDRAPNDAPAARIFWTTTPLMASTTVTVQLPPDGLDDGHRPAHSSGVHRGLPRVPPRPDGNVGGPRGPSPGPRHVFPRRRPPGPGDRRLGAQCAVSGHHHPRGHRRALKPMHRRLGPGHRSPLPKSPKRRYNDAMDLVEKRKSWSRMLVQAAHFADLDNTIDALGRARLCLKDIDAGG